MRPMHEIACRRVFNGDFMSLNKKQRKETLISKSKLSKKSQIAIVHRILFYKV
jgi:hypothetical protein